MTDWVVHKFGGTSLKDAERIERAARCVLDWPDRRAVVVSAVGGVTNRLLGALEVAASGADTHEIVSGLIRDHRRIAEELGVDAPERLGTDERDLTDLLHAVRLVGSADAVIADLVAGYGERWSAALFAAVMTREGHPAKAIDAGEVIVAKDGDMGPIIAWEESRERLERTVGDWSDAIVVTGYVARHPDGRPRTLGRNGSDFSAAIVGKLLDAQAVRIWTDVPGIMSADPRLVPEARVLQTLSYDEALELAYFGAAVLHPQTLAPLIEARIPLWIGDASDPNEDGTRIGPESERRFAIKGITAIENMALITLEGAGLMGVPGTARRLFGCLERAGISVVMISQASSEHSICCAVQKVAMVEAVERIGSEFATELNAGLVQAVRQDDDASVLAVVGAAMAGQPGLAAKFFSSLGRCGINVKAIAQGASERNISAVVANADAARAVRAVHAGFYLSPQTVSIGLIGVGNVGQALLNQLRTQIPVLADTLDLRIRAVANSRTMELGEDVAFDDEAKRVPLDLEALAEHVSEEHLPHTVMIDCTADDSVAALHPAWLQRGMHVVTPNKKGVADSLERYQAIRQAMRDAAVRYGGEATVGAGLPIIHTLRDLLDTGDRVIEIEGMLSGTLAYLFATYDGSGSFAELVREAWKSGYTEPDPRDDLSGLDVARKLVILAREMGLEIEVADVAVESLLIDGSGEGDAEAFLEHYRQVDASMAERFEKARAEGGVLRFVARLDAHGTASVGLKTVPGDHPFAMAQSTDNVVRFRTRRYDANPLVVQGPGAGPEVTAAGVFGDLLRVCSALGGHR
ncbi:MAG: bifunctional aspartate kinase/homoserine dehydrogenase I [Xanthomonadales bacterium]|nr:bifunctional aspartate kinase/homoserine dehydrogenase I [Xanthomonadales bacterium]